MTKTVGIRYLRLVTHNQSNSRYIIVFIFVPVILMILQRQASKHSCEIPTVMPQHFTMDKLSADGNEGEKLSGSLHLQKSSTVSAESDKVSERRSTSPSTNDPELLTFAEPSCSTSSAISKGQTENNTNANSTISDGHVSAHVSNSFEAKNDKTGGQSSTFHNLKKTENSPSNVKANSASPSLTSSEISVKVLLVTYYRGGSSFLGELLEENPHSYYWFEPIRAHVGKAVPSGLTIESQTKAAITITDDVNKDRVIIDDIFNLLKCSLSSVSPSIFKSSSIRKTAKAAGFRKCLSFFGFTNQSYNSCLPELTRQCLDSSINAVKVIRMPLFMAEYFWKIDPDIYVIHYVRDPRGMMLSRNAIHHYKNLTEEAKRVCRLMTINHANALKYAQERPRRFIELRYEDLALNSTSFVYKLYNFLGLDVPDRLVEGLDVNTHKNETNTYGTKRLSAQTAVKWKYFITADEKLQIDTGCYSILEKLGYPV